jgi:microcystin-dependent protein
MEPILGEIRMFAGNFAPRGWALCDGSLMSISTNTALFSILGTTYGGDGRTTFALPDLRGRLPMHVGAGPGLTPRTLGESSGSESVVLVLSQVPQHNHTVGCHSVADQSAPANSIPATEGTGGAPVYSTQGADGTMNPAMIGMAGGSQPHDNLSPFLCLTFIIALEGIFPSRN